ncbi:MAG TPA: hypothetical protein VG206_22710 [Terriglobia bacterium]|nr:hypothetical protein [Terriglobia bacterium]
MQFDPKLTLDGLMTLIGGALAFAAVMVQTVASSRGLQKQLDAES